MTDNIENLKSALGVLERTANQLNAQIKATQQELASLIAKQQGIKIGSIVRYEQEVGYAPNKRKIVKRFRVIRFELSGWPNSGIKLHGTTIRKDGSDGEIREIWPDYDYTLEPEEIKA